MSDIGVLLVNLGTPSAPTSQAVRRYLAEFLSDPRVVELPRWLWQPILRGVVLPLRAGKSAHAYEQVWGPDGSPLAAITAAQAVALQRRLGQGVRVAHAMRYGAPSLGVELRKLANSGVSRLLLAPLYPQYCGATTASVMDALSAVLGEMRWQPAVRTLPAYFADGLYIDALKQDLQRQLERMGFRPELLLLSFHGMPQRTVERGDPYYAQCLETARLLTEALGGGVRIEVSFQSRFGKAKWLEPSTESMIAKAAAEGVKRLAIAAPGFSADCLETREELAIRGRDQFLGAGGQAFTALDCLNDGAAGMDMLEALARRELAGWI